MTKSPKAKLRALGANLLLLVASSLVSLLILELFLRLYDPVRPRLFGDRVVLTRNSRLTMSNDENQKLDPTIVFSKNSIGFRGEEPPRDFDRYLTVVAIGGSTTECLYLSDGKSWPELLGKALSVRFERLWVNNAGLDGHSTFGHLLVLDQIVVKLRPKVSLFLVGINDVGRAMSTGREQPSPENPPLSVRLARHSAIAATLLNLRRHSDAESAKLPHREINLARMPGIWHTQRKLAETLLLLHHQYYLPQYRARVEKIVEVTRTNGIEPVFLTQPALYGPAIDPVTGVDLDWVEVYDEWRMEGGKIRGGVAWSILENYNEVVREVGKARGVLVIDVGRRLPKRSDFYYDFLHYTNEGSRAVADIAAEELCPFLAARFPAYAKHPCPKPFEALR